VHAIEKEVSIMENLNAVSETALLTLKARVIEAEKQSPVIHDAKGREILDKISSHVSTETQRRVLNRKLPSTLTSYLALRARNIKVMEEWSYFEDPDIRPRFQRLFRHFKSFSRKN